MHVVEKGPERLDAGLQFQVDLAIWFKTKNL